MGRKIPAKKHRGVKDPLIQQAKRVQSLQNKINAPPTDPDDQPVPKTLTRLFAFQNKKNETANKKSKKKMKKPHFNFDSNPVHSSRNPVSSLKRLAGESGRAFSLRINSAIKTLSAPDNYDYMEDMESEDVKGEAMAERNEKRARKRARGAGGAGKKGGEKEGGVKLTRGQKLTLRNKARKLKAVEAAAAVNSAVVYERVKFGDVVEAPPSLSAPRRATDNKHTARRDLLLYKMLDGATEATAQSNRIQTAHAQAERREQARLAAVAAYRALKSQRTKTKPPILLT